MPEQPGWVNGTLVAVDGIGVLLSGDAGVGKSETALALLARGHVLVSDDGVTLHSDRHARLIGSAPDCCAGFLLVRELGSLDVAALYGEQALRATQLIDLVIQLAPDGRVPSFVGLQAAEQTLALHGHQLPLIRLTGNRQRPWWVLVEAAAKNHRQRRHGIDAAALLAHRHSDHLQACEG